jgi:hypothetical protein
MSLRKQLLTRPLKRRRKETDRLFTPSRSPSPAASESSTSSTSAPPSREPSYSSSTDSTTSDEDDDSIPRQQDGLADDTDTLTEQGLLSISEGIRRARFQGDYFPADHFLAPPTPEQLRRKRKRKPRNALLTFPRQRQQRQPAKKALYVDPRVKKRLKLDTTSGQPKGQPMISVTIPSKPLAREEYILNTAEFIPVKVLARIYKPTLRRRRRRIDNEVDQGIGIGGYVIRFADGHEHSVPLPLLDCAESVPY